jgi:carbamoyltransferase
MIIDCAGSYITSVTEPFAFPPSMPSNTVEVASYYDCEADSMHCVAKQTWRMDWQDPQGLGAFYHLLTRRIFPGEGNEGKVMALASYGDPDALGLPPLATKHGMVLIPEPWRCLIASGDNYRFIEDDAAALKRCANFAAAGQRCFEKALLEVAGWLRKCTGKQNLCFAGGTALNCTANAKLLREAGFRDVYIPPAPHDGGTAVGCALYGLALLEGPNACRRFSWTNDYLGVPESQDDVSSIVRRYGNVEMVKPLNLSFEVAQLLANGLVVGLFQQRAEFGPRALGNRSILADPRNPGIRNWINEQVKGRELFRPLAPTVLAERAAEYFCVPCASPFMQYAVAVRPEVESAIRGVVHRDGSARIQTLEECINPLFYKIIDEFARLTGVPMVLNTSLNRKEEPIVETVNEAMACLTGSGMHALAIPPYLIKKRFIATNAQCSNE